MSRIRKIIQIIFSVIFIINMDIKAMDKIKIITTIEPIKYLIREIAGDKVEIKTLIPKGANPHTYEVKIKEMKALLNSDMYFKIGNQFIFEELWVRKLLKLNKLMREKDISKNIDVINSKIDNHKEHRDKDYHIWLSIKNSIVIADNIKSILIEEDERNKEEYIRNHKRLINKLERIHIRIDLKVKELDNKRFYVYHPSWGYYARDYKIKQMVIEDEGKEPSIKHLKRIIKEMKKNKARVLIAAKGFKNDRVKILAKQVGARIVEIDHLGGDYIENIIKLTEEIIK